MESTGIPGRIHCSQQTANELVAGGMSHWLEQRDEQIIAKGKGKLQTYFVNPKRGNGVAGAANTTTLVSTSDENTMSNDDVEDITETEDLTSSHSLWDSYHNVIAAPSESLPRQRQARPQASQPTPLPNLPGYLDDDALSQASSHMS